MREQVISSLRSLSDREHQDSRWGRYEEGVSYFDDLTLNIHVLYDDFMVLPEPSSAVPAVLDDSEVGPFEELGRVLDAMLKDLGDRPDADYLSDPRWAAVVETAAIALEAMRVTDERLP